MANQATDRPSWDRLYELAAQQAGYLTLEQARQAGYSRPLLHYHLARRHIERSARGIFRLVHFPPSDHEDLVVAWLWSEQKGVFSHETALMLHELSDVLPHEKHMTVPAPWAHRRLKRPRGVVLHFADLPRRDVQWHGAVRVTSPLRTLLDCKAASVSPDLVAQAQRQAVKRGLVLSTELRQALGRAARVRP